MFLLLLIILLPLIANVTVRTSYSKYSDLRSSSKLEGNEIARIILDSNGLKNVKVVQNNQIKINFACFYLT